LISGFALLFEIGLARFALLAFKFACFSAVYPKLIARALNSMLIELLGLGF
jgi:hypothetical protein